MCFGEANNKFVFLSSSFLFREVTCPNNQFDSILFNKVIFEEAVAMSQIDIFSSQPLDPPEVTDLPRKIPSTFPSRNLNFFKWISLFEWDENVQRPFTIFPVSRFGKEIKESWLTSALSSKAREKKLQLCTLENKSVSLFAKLESSKFLFFTFMPACLCF